MKSTILRISGILCLLIAGLTISGLAEPQAPPEDFHPVPPPQSGDYQLLFMGNSHTAANGMPHLVTAMIGTGIPGATASQATAPGYLFLADRINDGVSRPLLESRNWSHVVLQAQKYSSSGLYDYPTVAAEEWIRSAKAQGAQPILFPEWPRRGNTEEGERVHQLHLAIASREPACVAPVGLAFEVALERYPNLVLHAADGNHSSLTGALLAAFVLYEVITGHAAAELPYLATVGVSPEIQQNLKAVASEVIAADPQSCLGAPVSNPDGIPTLGLYGLTVLIAGLAMVYARQVHSPFFASRQGPTE